VLPRRPGGGERRKRPGRSRIPEGGREKGREGGREEEREGVSVSGGVETCPSFSSTGQPFPKGLLPRGDGPGARCLSRWRMGPTGTGMQREGKSRKREGRMGGPPARTGLGAGKKKRKERGKEAGGVRCPPGDGLSGGGTLRFPASVSFFSCQGLLCHLNFLFLSCPPHPALHPPSASHPYTLQRSPLSAGLSLVPFLPSLPPFLPPFLPSPAPFLTSSLPTAPTSAGSRSA